MKKQKLIKHYIRSFLASVLAMATWSAVQSQPARYGDGNMMNHADGWMGGWTSGWMWVWIVVGILVAVLIVVVIFKLLKK